MRLTKQIPGCPGEYKLTTNCINKVIDMLGEYEDTELKPEQIEALQQENAELRKDNEKAYYLLEMTEGKRLDLAKQLSGLQGKAVLVVGDMPECCRKCKYEFPFPIQENVHFDTHCGLLYAKDNKGNWLMKCIRKDKRNTERLDDCPLRIVGGASDE